MPKNGTYTTNDNGVVFTLPVRDMRDNIILHLCNSILLLGRLHVTNLPIRLMCLTSVCLSTFSFSDSNLKTLCLIEFKLDKEIDYHHIVLPRAVKDPTRVS